MLCTITFKAMLAMYVTICLIWNDITLQTGNSRVLLELALACMVLM